MVCRDRRGSGIGLGLIYRFWLRTACFSQASFYLFSGLALMSHVLEIGVSKN